MLYNIPMSTQLVIGDKNRSSWSFRPWLLMKTAGIAFKEIPVKLGTREGHALADRSSPSGKVPVLIDGKVKVWESLSICEYLADKYPQKNLWPKDAAQRAVARSVSNEMHAGFMSLRKNLPFNATQRVIKKDIDEATRHDIERVQAIWRECRKTYCGKGDFLFGDFTIADAMFAPVAVRFIAYGVEADTVSTEYIERILSLPASLEWMAGAAQEKGNDQ